MATPAHATQTWRFGVFEVDAHGGELLRAGVKIRLREQSFKVLILLLEHAGELVSREDLRKALWPADTFVDFDHSLNAAVMRLREALGDTADKPLYIETIPKRGYRFIAPLAQSTAVGNETDAARLTVDSLQMTETGEYAHESVSAEKLRPRIRLRRWLTVGSGAAFVALAALVWYLRRPLPPPRITEYVQLTSDGRAKTIEGTDGNNIYLNLWSPAGHATVPVSGGGLREIPIDLPTGKEWPSDNPILLGVSPDGSDLLVRSGFALEDTLWVIGNHGSAARYLASECNSAGWSPDARTVIYSTDFKGDIYTVSRNGGTPRLLLPSSARGPNAGEVNDLAWSPDGSRIRFVDDDRYWEISSDGTNLHEVLPHWHAANPKYVMWSGHWTPDGEFFLFAAASSAYSQDLSTSSQIWALDERHSPLHRANPEPVQLTTGASYWAGMDGFYIASSIASEGNLALSSDGTKVYSTGSIVRGELVERDRSSQQLRPCFGGISAEFLDFTRDGKYVVYVTYPEGLMWRASRDGTGLTQLNTRPLYPFNPRWSPNGTEIVFNAKSSPFSGGPSTIYTMPSQGGPPKRLLPSDTADESDPTWSPDGKRIAFAQGMSGRVRILEIATGRISELPSVPWLYSPRWSPDGRYILAIANQPGRRDLALFDLKTNRWSMLGLERGRFWCNWPSWSRDSLFIYFLSIDRADYRTDEPGVYRIPITGGKPQKVVDLKGFAATGYFGHWFGLDPDDSPLLLRNAGSREIYALTLERK